MANHYVSQLNLGDRIEFWDKDHFVPVTIVDRSGDQDPPYFRTVQYQNGDSVTLDLSMLKWKLHSETQPVEVLHFPLSYDAAREEYAALLEVLRNTTVDALLNVTKWMNNDVTTPLDIRIPMVIALYIQTGEKRVAILAGDETQIGNQHRAVLAKTPDSVVPVQGLMCDYARQGKTFITAANKYEVNVVNELDTYPDNEFLFVKGIHNKQLKTVKIRKLNNVWFAPIDQPEIDGLQTEQMLFKTPGIEWLSIKDDWGKHSYWWNPATDQSVYTNPGT